MKPYKIFIFFLIISVVLLSVSFFIPKDGIKIIDDVTFNYPTFKELWKIGGGKNLYADSVIAREMALVEEQVKEEVYQFPDSLESLLDIELIVKPFHIDTLKAKIQQIEFPNNNKDLLYHFFRKITHPKGVVRVLHYGDSQIEGDRISSFLRNRLQKQFGGYGVGLVSPKPLVKTFSIKQSYSDNWKRYPIFGIKEGKVSHNRYGIIGTFCRYKDYPSNVLGSSDSFSQKSIFEAELSFEKANSSFLKDRKFRNLKVFYANGSSPVLCEIYSDDQIVEAKYLDTNTFFSSLNYRFDPMPKSFRIKFTGIDSPDFYTIAIDADKGLVVDNIPMRGSSGTYFTKMDTELLKQFYSHLNIGMILLQFGGNVIPFIETDKGVRNYENWFYKQIRLLRKILPDVPIIVMGVADMSKKENEQIISYPYIVPLRDAMKRASFKAGVAYWDMYEAMGGENSMPQWVASNPKLATGDYTHFTPKGAKLMGNMFYNSLMYEYQKFVSK